ncbi:DUF664 domain-containing protein [uncultured Serinicoccus sp.]|uniref:mycothiol transferase n=1 Tax=uncultured Serinicoccus sp. TaxID=735514 RepID=UPI002629E5F5|nr:DUF664 domain-containing protein [uncultured Serinicoccus sp.]
MNTSPVWEPPRTGDETAHLLGALDRQRMTFWWKAEGLDTAGLRARVGASSLTLGGLLKHLTGVEAVAATWRLDGSSPGSPWAEVDWQATPGWDFESAADDPPQELYARYVETVAATRARHHEAIAADGLDRIIAWGQEWGIELSLRRMLFDVLEEYARHTGHADLLREAVDGRVGEDPPEDWSPPAAWT